jgi:hypothetical protein
MRARHAAALVLLEWFLIYPPFSAKPLSIHDNAPLTEWKVVGRFGTQSDCEKRKSVTEAEEADWLESDNPTLQQAAEIMRHTKCVANDDPRFQGKWTIPPNRPAGSPPYIAPN